MPFAPGRTGNPAGRPPKDGPKWANLAYWFGTIEKDLSALTPLQRVEMAKWAMQFLVDNAKALPVKKDTQKEAADLLTALEKTSRAGSSPSTETKSPGQVSAKSAGA